MPMTPLQSWAMILLLIIASISLVVIITDLENRISSMQTRRAERREQITKAMNRHPAGKARVIHIGHAPSILASGRPHLVVLDGGKRQTEFTSQRPYDWAIDGV